MAVGQHPSVSLVIQYVPVTRYMFKKILIANRGEIAVRIIQAAQSLKIATAAIYADSDQSGLHVQRADEAYGLGEGNLSDTYLNIEKIIEIAQHAGCEAIHPGYGFLSENPTFVEACEQAGITFIGPSSEVIKIMGDKIEARRFAQRAGVPTTEGATGSAEELLKQADAFSYPVLVKASAGGGGKGMRIVQQASELPDALASTVREAEAYFGNPTVYIEKYLASPRHIEVQLLGDHYGELVHLYERECSLQRRYQKIIEEAPSPTLTPELRKAMGEAAVALGKAIQYTNAGTIEFLLDQDHHFYFLEMNTRVQVEHPVTELTTRIDIVAEQIKIAAGESLSFQQDSIPQWGHAIECRVYAEAPERQFMPSPGTITYYHPPTSGAVRLDTAVTQGTTIDSRYDPMIGKLIAYGTDRERAREHAISALKNYAIHGIDTNISYLVQLLSSDDFRDNRISTHYCDQHTPELIERMATTRTSLDSLPVILAGLLYSLRRDTPSSRSTVWQEIGFWRQVPVLEVTLDGQALSVEMRRADARTYEVRYAHQSYAVRRVTLDNGKVDFTLDDQAYTGYVSENEDQTFIITLDGFNFTLQRNDMPGKNRFVRSEGTDVVSDRKITSPMPGKVITLKVRAGDEVEKGDTLLVVEAMKMENALTAPRNATIKEVLVAVDDRIDRNVPLILLE